MVHWKSKPLDQLNSHELKRALSELISHQLLEKQPAMDLNVLPVFITGLVAGAILSLVAALFVV